MSSADDRSAAELSGDHASPFVVLGLSADADEQDVRRRYLDLVRKHPPERDAEKFRQIHAAYQAASDPLVLARHLLREAPEPEDWPAALDHAAANPPRLSVEILLSLGNRSPSADESNEQVDTDFLGGAS